MDHMGQSAINQQLDEYVYYGNFMRPMELVAEGIPGGQKALENVLAIAEEADINLSVLDRFSYAVPFSGYNDPIAKIRKRITKTIELAYQGSWQIR